MKKVPSLPPATTAVTEPVSKFWAAVPNAEDKTRKQIKNVGFLLITYQGKSSRYKAFFCLFWSTCPSSDTAGETNISHKNKGYIVIPFCKAIFKLAEKKGLMSSLCEKLWQFYTE